MAHPASIGHRKGGLFRMIPILCSRASGLGDQICFFEETGRIAKLNLCH